MESVYIFGPIHIHGDDYRGIYEDLMDLSEKYFESSLGTYPDFWDTDEEPREFYDRTKEEITECDLFVAEVTAPSHGVGMELEMAVNNDIPVIALAKKGEEISSMVEGLPALEKVVRYEDDEDLKNRLSQEFQRLT
jgi:nucleoside 2-deoxyribosyltransferase